MKKIFFATILLFLGLGQVWGAGPTSTHYPGTYTSASGYNQSLTTVSGRNYEVYGFASTGSSANNVWAGTTTTSSSAKNYVLGFATTTEKVNGWIANYVNGRGSNYTSLSASGTEFNGMGTSGAYQMNYRSNSKLTIKVCGYDQFSFYGKDNSASNKFQVYVDGVNVTTGTSTTAGVRRFDISTGEHTIYITALNNSNCVMWGFSLRLPQAAPSALVKGTVGSTTADMTITDALNANKYEFYVSTSSTAPTSCTDATTGEYTTKTPQLTGLTASTTYYVWVRSRFSTTVKSAWTALTGSTFTTKSANTYFYRGDDNDWGATAMTISTGGMYEYIASTSSSNKFKIALAADSWDYNKDYNWSGFFMTDQDINLGDWGGDNCYIWDAPASYYIIVFKPNTSVNSSSNPHICVSTTLPDDSPSGLAATKTVYLDPGVWEASDAKYAICYVEHNGEWSGFMTESPCFDGVYQTTIPAWVSNVEIVRFSNDATDSDISYDGGKCWNYSGHLGSMPSGAARFTVYQTGGTWNDLNTSNWSTPDLPTYTISYAKGSVPSGGGSISGSKDSESKTCGTDFTLPSSAVFTTTGYTQTGWATSDGGSKAYDLGGSYTTNAAHTFYPFWTIRSYTLTWNLNGGKVTTAGTGAAVNATGSPSSSVNYGALITTPVVAKAYHSFTGWNTTPATTMPAANTTYTAQWSANQYSVSHTLTDATKTSGATGDNAATYGTSYTAVFAAAADHSLPTDITVTIGGATKTKGTEYTWNPETGTVTITGSYITGAISITVTAVELGYRVTYAGNGSTGGTVPSDDTLYDPDAEVTVAAGLPTKTNYAFIGWLNSVDNTIYRAGQSFTITAGTTLTAQWQGTVADEDFYWSNYVSSPLSAHTAASLKSKTTATTITISGMSTGTGTRATDNATSIVDGTSYNFTSSPVYIKMSSGNSIYFTTTKTSTIKIQYVTNSSSTSGIELRASSSTGTVKGSSSVTDKQLKFQTLTVSNLAAGTYYIVAVNKEINIGAIVVTYAGNKTGYDVTFDKNGKTAAAGMPANYSGVPSGKKIAEPTEIPTVSNFIFDGWVTTSGGSTAFDFANTTITTNKTIYAKWVAKTAPTQYTFSLSDPCTSANPSGTLSGSQSGWSYQLYKSGVASGDPKAGTGSALTWTGLTAGTYKVMTVESSTQASAQIGSTATVYASTSITSNLATSRSVNANVATTVSITATGASPTYQWYTCNSDGTGKVAIDGKTTNTFSYTFTNADAPTKYICCVVTGTCGTVTSTVQTVTITPTYLLTYDANGGSGAPAAAYRPATTAALSSTVPTRSNYAFEGWNTKSNGSGTRYAAGASFPMPAQATTLYAEWVEMDTLTWTLNVNTAEETIGTKSKASTNARISSTTGMTNLANYGSLAITSSAKSDLTSKIGTPASYDANKYMYVTFTVPAGYEFVPTSISVKAQPVSTNKDVKLILTDGANTITKTQTNLSQGSTTPVTETNSAKTAFKGTVTLKIYCYGATDAYRLGTPITVSGKVRPVTLTYVGGSGSNWNTTANWSPACIPTIDHDVVIEVPVDVNITNARAKSVVIYNNGSTKTGQLVLGAGKELVVDRTVRKTTNGSTYTATGENDIVFNSTSALGLGALAIGDHAAANGLNDATVNFATLSSGSKNSTASVAQYVGTPFSNEPEMLYQFYNSWMYKYVNDGEPGWERVKGDDGLKAFEGYCVFSADAWDNDGGHTYWMQGTLVASQDKEIDLVYNGDDGSNPNNENMLANSWMAPIKIKAFQASDFTNTDAAIYIFNAGSPADYETRGSSTGTSAGQYQAYSPGTALATDVIPSMQAFSVYTNDASPSITLDYSRLVYDPAVAGLAVQPNKAPRRAVATTDEPDRMRLYVKAESGYGDMLYMLEREDYEDGFENGYDARKMFGEDVAPQLYTITPDGNMAISCVPTYEGQVLGFRKGTNDNVYTFTFDYAGENTWYLNDMKEQTSTLISSESMYLFFASESDMTARFIISATPILYAPTGVEDTAVSGQQSDVRKLVIDDHVFIIRNGRMYDVTGVMVR